MGSSPYSLGPTGKLFLRILDKYPSRYILLLEKETCEDEKGLNKKTSCCYLGSFQFYLLRQDVERLEREENEENQRKILETAANDLPVYCQTATRSDHLVFITRILLT